MTREIQTLDPKLPVIAYARFLVEMHRLINEGKGDGEEAEALADRMDAPWHAMTSQEQPRMRGLAADLNALREGGPKRVEMNPEHLKRWQLAAREAYTQSEAGDVDLALNFLRQPVPSGLPSHIIPFLQARCWEKLGDLETALVFMKEADRLDPNQALSVLALLQQLERVGELPAYANRVINNPASPPLELYIAAVALYYPTRRMNDAEAKPIIQKIVTVLQRALSDYLALPPTEREVSPGGDSFIALALGFGLERLGNREAAIEIYSQAITRYPREGELLVARGLAYYGEDQKKALADFVKAVHWGVVAIWPYLLLARHALQSGVPAEAFRLALAAENQPGPAEARAEVYETIAIALSDLGQPKERVLENFDRALGLDPKNARIRENRDIAATLAPRSPGGRVARNRLRRAPTVKPEGIRGALSEQITNRSELLKEQHHSRVAMGLVASLPLGEKRLHARIEG